MSFHNDFETAQGKYPTNSVYLTSVDVVIPFATPARKE
jgi:hypothetical protein